MCVCGCVCERERGESYYTLVKNTGKASQKDLLRVIVWGYCFVWDWTRVLERMLCAVWPEKKSPNVYQSCREMLSLEYFDTFTKIVRDLGKFKAKGLKKLSKVQ